jgi:hypothetical protein
MAESRLSQVLKMMEKKGLTRTERLLTSWTKDEMAMLKKTAKKHNTTAATLVHDIVIEVFKAAQEEDTENAKYEF